MTTPLDGTGRKIRVGPDEHQVTVTEAMQKACNTATWATIINKKHPGEGYDNARDEAYGEILRELRKQVTPEQDPDLDRPYRLKVIAEWLGHWNVRTGKSRDGWAEPVRSVMDIPLVPECAPHGLMHDCPVAGR